MNFQNPSHRAPPSHPRTYCLPTLKFLRLRNDAGPLLDSGSTKSLGLLQNLSVESISERLGDLDADPSIFLGGLSEAMERNKVQLSVGVDISDLEVVVAAPVVEKRAMDPCELNPTSCSQTAANMNATNSTGKVRPFRVNGLILYCFREVRATLHSVLPSTMGINLRGLHSTQSICVGIAWPSGRTLSPGRLSWKVECTTVSNSWYCGFLPSLHQPNVAISRVSPTERESRVLSWTWGIVFLQQR